MKKKLFISHNSNDSEVAEIISSTFSRITLNQIITWYSSDNSAVGGMYPGSIWLDEIRTKLRESRAIIVLLTPSSIKKPWLLFESGFGAANVNCDVIPICIGISIDQIPFPLAMYQTFQLSDYNSLRRFFSKVLERYEIIFDEGMAKPVLQKTISDLVKIRQPKKIEKEITIEDAVNDVKEHIDRRLLNFVTHTNADTSAYERIYTVPVSIEFPDFKTEQFIEINHKTTVQEVLHSIAYLLDGWVFPYTYLESWIVIEKTTHARLVVLEVAEKIPASYIFTPQSSWYVVLLDKAYTAKDSAKKIVPPKI